MARYFFRRCVLVVLVIYIFLAAYFLANVQQFEDSVMDDITGSSLNRELGKDADSRNIKIEEKGNYIHGVSFQDKVDRKFRNSVKIPPKNVRMRPTTKVKAKWRTLSPKTLKTRQNTSGVSTTRLNFTGIAPNMYVYSAYFDERLNNSYVRLIVIAPSGRKKTNAGVWCIFGDRKDKSSAKFPMSEFVYYETCENHLMQYAFYILSCPVPNEMMADGTWDREYIRVISSKDKSPTETVLLPLINNKLTSSPARFKHQGKFSVCIPPLFGKVNVVRLVEFIELSRLLGSQHFTFYTYDASDDLMTLLLHYQRQGLVTVLPWSIPSPKRVWYKGQSAAIADCLFRNMYIYELVAFNDIDEFIMPREGDDWTSMLDYIHINSKLRPNDVAVYRFKSAFFERSTSKESNTNLTPEMKMFISLDHTSRTSQLSNIRTKMLVRPIRVFEIGIHHLSKPIRDDFATLEVSPDNGILHHYRKCDNNWGMSCAKYEKDKTAHKYKDRLIKNTKAALKTLKYSQTAEQN